MATIYRADTIGSLLRPAYLKEARQAWEAGVLPTPEFKRIEDRAVDEALALQEAAGLDVVTDGEMRRYLFTGVLTEAIDGIEHIPGVSVHWHGQTPQEEMDFQLPFCITGKIRRRSLATEEFASARGKTRKPLKIALPSPMLLTLFWSPEHSPAAYRDPFELFADAVDLLRQDVYELASLGCEYIQIDAPELATIVDESIRRTVWQAIGVPPARMLSEGIEMLNAIADVPGVVFGLHMCRGNNQGRWLSQGGYEAISKQVFPQARHYDIFLLEYDNWRSGSFEPLADMPPDKRVVLGLVSTKTNSVEPAEGIVARIEDASRYFPHEQLALSMQCGFAPWPSMGNPITEAMQEAKLRLVADVAHRVWA